MNPASFAPSKASQLASSPALDVADDAGLTQVQVEARRKEGGYNEASEEKSHSVRKLLRNF